MPAEAVAILPGRCLMARSLRLRRWQKAALDVFLSSDGSDFLAVATPGSGKTTFALAAVRVLLGQHPERRVIIVAPTHHLKLQWAEAAAALDLHLETAWSSSEARLPSDVHGLVTTYQQVALSAADLAVLARDAIVVLDEVHHAGDEQAWGQAVRIACRHAAVRLCLSGTPFRSDTRAIPFVRYDDDAMARPDVEYGYADALRDGGVVRPVRFPRIDGEMEWIGSDGTHAEASFADHLDAAGTAQRLRTALSVEGDWIGAVLERAHAKLSDIRRTHPDAAGLVIAIDQDHARGIAQLLRRRCGVDPVVAVSEDAAASRRITEFAAGTRPWIVAVRMISEGVDIPRLRVGVFATTTTTELFFRQAVGRLVRWTRGLGPQPAYMFLPDDPRLRHHAGAIAEQRRHSLRRLDERGDPIAAAEPDDREVARTDEAQMSLFAPLAARPIGDAHGVEPESEDMLAMPEPDDDDSLVLELAPAPRTRAGGDDPQAGRPRSAREQRRTLRDANAAAVAELVRVVEMNHAQINAELNRLVGIQRVGEATVDELERRRGAALVWLARSGRPR
jgi:superfamily II DNA or RNA helicase